jgi:uncharacterized protein (DUF1778 family)
MPVTKNASEPTVPAAKKKAVKHAIKATASGKFAAKNITAKQSLRTAPINLRVRPAQRELIDRAAQILDLPRTDFMLEAATRAAENVLLDQRLFMLDKSSYQAFEKALNAPVAENPALRRLLATRAPWES